MTVKRGALNRIAEKCDEAARLSSSLDTTGRARTVIEASNMVD